LNPHQFRIQIFEVLGKNRNFYSGKNLLELVKKNANDNDLGVYH
jgi:hypothetical protein